MDLDVVADEDAWPGCRRPSRGNSGTVPVKSAKSPAKRRRRTSAPDPDELLREYAAKRDFEKTAEPGPAGSGRPLAEGNRFVVQRHRARRLHYDLRLEMDGTLVSWAVPKGPTLDPAVKRMAAHVEDHPLAYYDFEGVIPKGEYGGGDVIVWDWGTWEPAETSDPRSAVEEGELHFDLHGEKLSGRFAIIRRGDDRSWLLVHKRDESAVDGWDAEQFPKSVKSGLDNDEIAARGNDVWHRRRSTILHPPPTSQELDELDALPNSKSGRFWTYQGRELRLTNLDKVLFPPSEERPGVTKRELIRYMVQVAPWMLPYLSGRPANFKRHPDGAGESGFWQKAYPPHAPEWMTPWRNLEADPGETEEYLVVEEPATLAFVANWGVLEVHAWTSTTDAPHQPTWAMIDIDPGTATTWEETLTLARLYRTALEHLGVRGGPKVSGRRGIQIWVPVRDGYTFDDTRTWVETLSRAIGAVVPDLVSWEWQTDRRAGKARLDYTQNAINKTLVTPYSPRAVSGAPVSVPITWDELDDPDLRPDRWTVNSVIARLESSGDPLAGLLGLEQDLPAPT
jgi:bifunctional non-homologous end joining protein LigD